MNPEHQANYAQAWHQGTYNEIPHENAWQNYAQFSQNASPQQVEQAHQQVYEQVPAQQRSGLLQSLMSGLAQRGVTPQQLGIQNTDPNTMSSSDAARVTAYAQQNAPDLFQQLFGPGGALSSPLAKMVIAGAVAYAASRFLGGNAGNQKAGNAGNQNTSGNGLL